MYFVIFADTCAGVGIPSPGVPQALHVSDLTDLEDQVFEFREITKLINLLSGSRVIPSWNKNPSVHMARQGQGCLPLP